MSGASHRLEQSSRAYNYGFDVSKLYEREEAGRKDWRAEVVPTDDEKDRAKRHELVLLLGTTPLSPAPAWLRSALPRDAPGQHHAGATKCGWRVRANGDGSFGYISPAHPSHHYDAQGAHRRE